MTTYSIPTNAPGLGQQADYADALLTARRAKNTLFVLLLLLLLGQLILFALAKTGVVNVGVRPSGSPAAIERAVEGAADATIDAGRAVGDAVADAAGEVADEANEVEVEAADGTVVEVEPADPPRAPRPAANTDVELGGSAGTPVGSDTAALVHYALGFSTFLGLVFAVVLTLVLLLILLVILNSRAYGAAAVTSAFIWMLMLAVLLFPWYAFLNYGGGAADFRIPGVLYTWRELQEGAGFVNDFSTVSASAETILKWARFVGFPILGLILLVLVQTKSGRGVRQALGEADVRRTTVTEERVNV